jgi:hypothetical protein
VHDKCSFGQRGIQAETERQAILLNKEFLKTILEQDLVSLGLQGIRPIQLLRV